MKALKDISIILTVVCLVMAAVSVIPISLGFMNPFSAKVSDYDYTDILQSKFTKTRVDPRIILVNCRKPDRKKIAQGLQVIQAANPKVIGVDVVFEGLKDEKIDSFLAEVIHSSSNTVLADEYSENDPKICHSLFCNEENSAYINFVAKENEAIRYAAPFLEEKKSFAAHIVQIADSESYSILKKRNNAVEQIKYRGSLDANAQINLEDLVQGDSLTAQILKNKIVLIGYLGDDEWSQSSRDKYHTPLNGNIGKKSLPDMFGLGIHANTISMMLDSDYINVASKKTNFILNAIWIIFLVILFRYLFIRINRGYYKLVRLLQLSLFFLLFVILAICFYFYNLKLNLLSAILAVVVVWDVTKAYFNIFVLKQSFFKKKENS